MINRNTILLIGLGVALGLILAGILFLEYPRLLITRYVDDYNFKPVYAIIDILLTLLTSLSLIFTGTIILITIINKV